MLGLADVALDIPMPSMPGLVFDTKDPSTEMLGALSNGQKVRWQRSDIKLMPAIEPVVVLQVFMNDASGGRVVAACFWADDGEGVVSFADLDVADHTVNLISVSRVHQALFEHPTLGAVLVYLTKQRDFKY